MSTNEEAQPAEPQQAATNGVAADFDAEALHRLAGFFDVLIQMDLANKRNEKREQNGEDAQTIHEH